VSLALQDHATSGRVALGDHALGSAIVEIDGGAMLVATSGLIVLPPPNWLLSGGIWNDAAQWNDAALWEDS